MAETPLPFHAERYELAGGAAVTSLTPLSAADAATLGPMFASIDPWARLGLTASAMTAFLNGDGDGALRYRIGVGGALAGAVVVRPHWLAGPYLATLGLVPRCQRQRLGLAVMGWLEAEARRAGARNVWLCVSAFNDAAIGLYRSCGFEHVADLDDLIKDGERESFMRKRLAAAKAG